MAFLRVRKVVFWASLCPLLASCAAKSDAVSETPTGTPDAGSSVDVGSTYSSVSGIVFTFPEAGASVSGQVSLGLELVGGSLFEAVSFSVDDGATGDERGFRSITLDTLQLANGPHTLHASVRTASGDVYTDELTIEVYNPEQRLLRTQQSQRIYTAGEEVVIELVYDRSGLDVSVDFSRVDGTSARVHATELEDGKYELRHRLSKVESGGRSLYVSATNGAGESVHNNVEIEVRNQPPLPFAVDNALFVESEQFPYEVTDVNASTTLTITGSHTVLGGAKTPLAIEWEPSDEYSQLVLRAEGFSGYYVIPLAPGQSSAEIAVSMPAFKRGTNFDPIDMALGLAGLASGVSFTNFKLEPFATPSKGIQFVLRWDGAADLDLEVKAPDGTIIGFENPSQARGSLDLDANSQCAMSPAAAEIISWPAGKEPAGEYEVRVNMYDACGTENTTYELLVISCDSVEPHVVTLGADAADTSGLGKVIDTVTHNCVQHAEGVVTYEKKVRSGSPTFVPAPFVPARAVRESDNQVLAQGFTDENGNYSLSFANDGSSKYHIEVEASWADPIIHKVRATVVPLTSDEPYRYQGSQIDAKDQTLVFEDIAIALSDNSGAFNIINVVRVGMEWLLKTRSVFLPPLASRWTQGERPLDFADASFFFNDQLFVGGHVDDPDEFDDPVLMHEFMHYVVSRLSDDDHIGGPHDGTHTGPLLAWKEGVATGLSLLAREKSPYFDMKAGHTSFMDYESATDESGRVFAHILGTSDKTQTGDLSEDLIAMVFWDLFDPANETHDLFAPHAPLVYRSVFEFIRDTEWRGVLGTDFIDFLDGLRCMTGPGYQSSLDPSLKTLLDERQFPYDFATSGFGCDGF